MEINKVAQNNRFEVFFNLKNQDWARELRLSCSGINIEKNNDHTSNVQMSFYDYDDNTIYHSLKKLTANIPDAFAERYLKDITIKCYDGQHNEYETINISFTQLPTLIEPLYFNWQAEQGKSSRSLYLRFEKCSKPIITRK